MKVYPKNKRLESKIKDVLQRDIIPTIAYNIRPLLMNLSPELLSIIQEIRIRQGKPLMIVGKNKDFMINKKGESTDSYDDSYIVSYEDCFKTLQLISQSSLYAFEEEIRNGYITLAGGHRVGLVGRAVIENGKIKTLKNITGFNFRISREVIGAADKVMSYLISSQKKVFNTLIISPPQCGKTTLLRDIARQLSNGISLLNFPGIKVCVVDERSEIASCYNGMPQNDLGIRTDVLDGCPKAEGMMLLIRSMSPHVIITDEIGRREDVIAIEEAVNAGVSIITTLHGSNLKELKKRPIVKEILETHLFERLIFLSNRLGVGTIEQVLEGDSFNPLIDKPFK
ncbi:MAG: stage sporulation protein [Thermosediminibacterales bacterium]|nr:stage sporulation protein [Thermosediminibacterales bacterium]